MTGVNAHPDSRLVFDMVDNAGNLFKCIAEVAALSGSILDNSLDSRSHVEGDVDWLGNQVEATIGIDKFQMTPGMKVE